MGDAESELGFGYFALGTDKFAGSPSRYNSRLIEGDLQRQLHKLKMGYERGWRHPDMGAVCAPPPVPRRPLPESERHPRINPPLTPTPPPPGRTRQQYKDKPGEWVRVFLTFSSEEQGELNLGNIIVQNKDGEQVERGTEEICWNEAVDGPWDADRHDADDITSTSGSDTDIE